MKEYAAANPHMNLLDTASLVILVIRIGLLSDTRRTDNKILVFGNDSTAKVECMQNLGIIRNVNVLKDLISIIVSVYGLQQLGMKVRFENTCSL